MTRLSTKKTSSSHKKTLPYGNWPSRISAELVVSNSISIDEPKATSDSVYYIERRPQEKGRCVIVKASRIQTHSKTTKNFNRSDILPAPYSARSRVHEYGGGSYCIANEKNEKIFFINDDDQDIYCITNRKVKRVTHCKNKRFSDFVYDEKRQCLISVCETHDNITITNSIVSINIANGACSTLVQGNDFYASPRLNNAANQLCWQSWDHPNMPWDGNQLWLANIDDAGKITHSILIAGAGNISTFQPQWSPDDVLYFISDDTGWWHLYRCLDSKQSIRTEKLSEGEKEFGLPQWVFAQSSYAFIDEATIICYFQSYGQTTLALLAISSSPNTSPSSDTSSGTTKTEPHKTITTLNTITTPWQDYRSIVTANNTGTDNCIYFIAASDQCFPQLISATINNNERVKLSTCVIRTSCQLPLTADNFSSVQHVEFTNRHNQKVYANYYPPTNPDYRATDRELPALIVICHGGPTGQASIALDPKKQFWTSRGFALLDVNHSGSTGYGRDYRLRLNNNWGRLDVEDCCDAAHYAVSQGLADKDRLIIRGSSAGGYTVLSALTFQQVFSAGASYYGISELCSLANDTHKFESHYLERLIGPYPKTKELYQQRSPINHSEQLNCPVIFFQGIEDRVVPKMQAEKMVAALDKKGVAVAAQYFAGEQHGFRKAETIMQSLENELNFYRLIFHLKAKNEITFTGDIQLKNI